MGPSLSSPCIQSLQSFTLTIWSLWSWLRGGGSTRSCRRRQLNEGDTIYVSLVAVLCMCVVARWQNLATAMLTILAKVSSQPDTDPILLLQRICKPNVNLTVSHNSTYLLIHPGISKCARDAAETHTLRNLQIKNTVLVFECFLRTLFLRETIYRHRNIETSRKISAILSILLFELSCSCPASAGS